EHAGREEALGVVELRTPANRTARAIDDVVDEIHAAVMGEVGLVDELQSNRGAAEAGFFTAVACQPLVAQQRRLIEREFEPDRVDGDNRRQQGSVAAGAARHQVAYGHTPVADATRDRRPELGVLEIELGLAHHRLACRHPRLALTPSLPSLLPNLLAHPP